MDHVVHNATQATKNTADKAKTWSHHAADKSKKEATKIAKKTKEGAKKVRDEAKKAASGTKEGAKKAMEKAKKAVTGHHWCCTKFPPHCIREDSDSDKDCSPPNEATVSALRADNRVVNFRGRGQLANKTKKAAKNGVKCTIGDEKVDCQCLRLTDGSNVMVADCEACDRPDPAVGCWFHHHPNPT